MKWVNYLTLAFTIICMMALPTYFGVKFDKPVLGIIIGGVATISYILYVALNKK